MVNSLDQPVQWSIQVGEGGCGLTLNPNPDCLKRLATDTGKKSQDLPRPLDFWIGVSGVSSIYSSSTLCSALLCFTLSEHNWRLVIVRLPCLLTFLLLLYSRLFVCDLRTVHIISTDRPERTPLKAEVESAPSQCTSYI